MSNTLSFDKKSEQLYRCLQSGVEIGIIHHVGDFLELDVSTPLWPEDVLREVLAFMQKLKVESNET